MTDRRSGPPLFDLMRERGDAPQMPRPEHGQQQQQHKSGDDRASNASDSTATTTSQPITQPRPRQTDTRSTAWDSTGGVSRAERSAAAMLDEPVQSDAGITLSVPRFYTMIAVALVLIVGAWAGGYRIGYTDGKDEMSQFVRTDQPVVSPQTDPSGTPPSSGRDGSGTSEQATSNPATQPGDQTGSQTGSQQGNQRTVAESSAAGAIMTPTGFRQDDPRTPGMNYLMLATLPTEQAADAISFLRANGVTAIGVPQLDSGRGSANNPSRYALYSLGLAIPGNRWSAMSNQRAEHQQLLANLGKRWQRERQGGSDFSQPLWEKYEP